MARLVVPKGGGRLSILGRNQGESSAPGKLSAAA